MDSKKFTREIRSTKWWQADGPIAFRLLFAPIVGFSKISKYYPSLRHQGIIHIFENDYGYQFMAEADSVRFIKFLMDNAREDTKYIGKKIKLWRSLLSKISIAVKEINKNDLNKISNRKLFNLFEKFFVAVSDAWAVPLILDGSDFYFNDDLVPRVMKNCSCSEKEALEKLFILTATDKLSFIKKEHIELLKISLDFISNGISTDITEKSLKSNYPIIFRKLSNHQKKFYWIRNNYLDSVIITVSEFLKEAIDIIKIKTKKQIEDEINFSTYIKKAREMKKKVKKELSFSKELLREIKIYESFGWWQDERKKINLQTGHYITLLIKEISRRASMDYKDGYYLLDNEIEDLLLRKKEADIEKIKDRRGLIVSFTYDSKPIIIKSGKEAKFYRKEIFNAVKRNISLKSPELTGLVAYMGNSKRIQSKVSIVLDVYKDKFKEGNILVTSMTRPEFVPLVKKAKAIITNEGGITCHAAIISRELKIPCIVGTKIATKVLKDGDIVEVDTGRGIVKILKKK